jgi:hypothetical protein
MVNSNKILLFGDSFIGIFKLLKNKNIKIYKYKGASMRGLLKEQNQNRKDIIKRSAQKQVKCCIFSFGQVDLHFTYYYKRFIKKEKMVFENIAKSYVEFINSLNECENKIIIGVYPSAVLDENVRGQLLHYEIIDENTNVDDKYFDFNFRFNLYTKFNEQLKRECKKYNIEYIDVGKIVLGDDNKVKSKYIDPISPYNVHLIWETLLPKLVKKMCNDKLKLKCISKCSLDKTLKGFIKEKTIRYKKRYESN